MISDAIGLERISRIVGYKIKKGDFRSSSPNLPQRIVIIGEANDANQGALDTDPVEVLSAKQAGEEYGYGSPIHAIMRILRPVTNDGVGSIPTIVIAQAAAVGAAFKVITVTPSGVATGNGTHYLKIAGRTSVDGSVYAINVETGDTVADINQKIEDAVNAVLGSPMGALSTDYVSTLTSKWKGLSADGLNVTVDTGLNDLGLTYAINSTQSGSGTPSVAAGLALIGDDWATIVINAYGAVTSVLDALEDFNGIPDADNPTGRYQGVVMKPFIALCGTVADDASAITDARELEVTNAFCPAPGSAGMAYEAAANVGYLFALQAQNNPHLDIAGQYYPDMPTPTSIGSMAVYTNRDAFVKKGLSTVVLIAGKYQVQDFVTTYHPEGEEPPQFRYCRNLMVDFNIRYGYYLLESINVLDHAIANNDDVVSASKVVKPKQWIQILNSYADDLTNRALIVEPDFMKASIDVGIGTANPDRFETFFRYKRSAFVRQVATTAEAGFNFGTLN